MSSNDSERLWARPNDLLEFRCPQYGIVWQWRVLTVHLGGLGQEGLIEVQPVMAEPGRTHSGVANSTWVPEPMTRNLTLVRVDPNGARIVHEGGQ